MTALTLYYTSTASTTLTNAGKLGVTTGGSQGNGTWGTRPSTAVTEELRKATAANRGAGIPSTPSEYGQFLESATLALDGQSIPAGTWTATMYMQYTGSVWTGRLSFQVWKRTSAGVYSLIGAGDEGADTGLAVSYAARTASFTTSAATDFASGDSLYLETYFVLSLRPGTSSSMQWYLSTTASGVTTAQIVTPGYAPTPVTYTRSLSSVSAALQALDVQRPLTGISADVSPAATTYTHTITGVSAAVLRPPLVDATSAITTGSNGYGGRLGYAASVSTTSWSHTTTSAANRLLVVTIGTDLLAGAPVVDSITYGGTQSLTKVAQVFGTENGHVGEGSAELWYLIGPASGAHTIAVTLSGTATDLFGSAVTFSNVHQGAPLGEIASFGSSSAGDIHSPMTVTVTPTNGTQVVIDSIAENSSGLTVNPAQTQIIGVVGTQIYGASSYRVAGPASTTMSWTPGFSTTSAQVAAAFNPFTPLGIPRFMTGVSASLSAPATYTRPLSGISAAVQALGVQRSLSGLSTALQALGIQRPLTGVSATVQAIGIARSLTGLSIALQALGVEHPLSSLSAATQALGLTRAITGVSAAGQALDIQKPVTGVSAAVEVPAPPATFDLCVSIGGIITSQLGVNFDATIDALAASGVTWLRTDFSWWYIQENGSTYWNWGLYDDAVAYATSKGINLLPVFTGVPTWALPVGCTDHLGCPPANNSDFTTYVTAVVNRYKTAIHYWEIFNEPNGGLCDVATYTTLLIATYTAIKAEDATATVISGGMSPAATGGGAYSPYDWLAGIYTNGGGGSFDILGHHPYCFAGPSYVFPFYATWSAWSQMEDTPQNLRDLMIANGDEEKVIWGTEFGAPTGGDGLAITEVQQAQLVTDAHTLFYSKSWGGKLFWYTYEDECDTSTDRNCFFGLIAYGGSPKPAYDAYTALLSGLGRSRYMTGISAALSTGFSDSFTRTIGVGLGNADTGHGYSSYDATLWSVTGSNAQAVTATPTGYPTASPNGLLLTDAETHVKAQIGAGSTNQVALAVRDQSNLLQNCYHLSMTTTQLLLQKMVSNTPTALQTISQTHDASLWYHLKLRVYQTDIYGKCWLDGQAEPATWQVTGSDSQWASGRVCIRGMCVTANVAVLFDDWSATSIVERAVTGISAATQALGLTRPLTGISLAIAAFDVERPLTSISVSLEVTAVTYERGIVSISSAVQALGVARAITGVSSAVQAFDITRPVTGISASLSLSTPHTLTGISAATQATDITHSLTSLSVSLAVTSARSLSSVSAALQALDVQRPLTDVSSSIGVGGVAHTITGVSAAVKQLGLERTLSPISAATQALGLTRPLTGISTSVIGTYARAITSVSSALKGIDIGHVATPVSAATKALGVTRPVTSIAGAIGQGDIPRALTGISAATQAVELTRSLVSISAATQALGVTHSLIDISVAAKQEGVTRSLTGIRVSLLLNVRKPLTALSTAVQAINVSHPLTGVTSSLAARHETNVTGITFATQAFGVTRTLTGLLAAVGIAGLTRPITGIHVAICLPVTLSYTQMIVSSPRGACEATSPQGTLEVVSPRGMLQTQEE